MRSTIAPPRHNTLTRADVIRAAVILATPVAVDEHTIPLALGPVFYRSAPAPGITPVYLHGVPTSSDDWEPVLARTGGIAPDLLGFGRSSKGGQVDLTLGGLADGVMRVIEHADPGAVRLVGHDWGALVALELARRAPDAVAGLTLISPVALVAGHAWSGLARAWTTPIVGELAMGAVTRGGLGRRLRAGCTRPERAWPRERIQAAWEHFDQGTQRAVLRLHRSTAPDHLARTPPPEADTTVVRGERDPWLSSAGARAVADQLGAALTEVPEAGHWPWLDVPEASLP
jgi:pimeloyl-ACP methyl ester carboxylesterase